MIQIACDTASVIFPDFKYAWLADEFRTRLPRELDFGIEAQNAERCRKIFKNDKRIKVPDIYANYTRDRVLVMSYEQGIPVTHVKKMLAEGINLKELSNLISESFNHMIFKEGFVHADPHPGNLFVRQVDGHAQLVILDHGIYTELS
jgi:aarF domain-containing kinase